MTSENRENKVVRGQMSKGILEFTILLIISKEPAYASDIIEKLRDHDLLVVEGTLYPLLSRLSKLGLVAHDWKESESGPPRKYYTLTEEGTKRLEELTKEWKQLQASIKSLTKDSL